MKQSECSINNFRRQLYRPLGPFAIVIVAIVSPGGSPNGNAGIVTTVKRSHEKSRIGKARHHHRLPDRAGDLVGRQCAVAESRGTGEGEVVVGDPNRAAALVGHRHLEGSDLLRQARRTPGPRLRLNRGAHSIRFRDGRVVSARHDLCLGSRNEPRGRATCQTQRHHCRENDRCV